MQLFKTKASELSELSDFYVKCGYGGTFDGSDDVFYAVEDNCIFAVVRIALEYGVLVLRGMQVLPTLRGQKIGRKLLSYTSDHIAQIKAPCYCLAHHHLVRFYGDAGFIIAEPKDVPEFLIKRKLKYVQQGLNIDLMVRQ
ncbi:MAG: GNAT superfamily N-acetyltransferase [Psychromonas sp.]|jgi:GNAT superfamily N-acetyltransferase|uniref:GNAT family N-acetyltransferase n=1 Tax=Psychromonas sp. TaxID=1884585 RepID=UPI0039E646BF